MADRLHFSLVTPERELFSGEVDQVVAPGSEGDFGVLPNHAPFMSTLRPGWITVHDGDRIERVVVRAGFAEVTPRGLTILAEEATPVSQIDAASVEARINTAQSDVANAANEAGRDVAQQRLDYLLVLREAATAGTAH
jgi:F-type H+-transporting ATPase subunit epsilon